MQGLRLPPVPRIHLYLDIDGVLNAEARALHRRAESPWPGGYNVPAPYYGATIALDAVFALNRLIARYRIVGHWLTTWGPGAPQFGDYITLAGSDRWPVLATEDVSHSEEWQKFTSIRAHLAITRPDITIWIDDHLDREREAREWAEAAGILAVAPDPEWGIEPRHIDLLERHIAHRLAELRPDIT
ncbi:HAD domain-containing protein [Sinomonas halotolerans]|uniref:Secreted protein n=1 Tax=Sinomonas halotolerans TaxID=1644133 RepID=A0ABU9WW30_9MICC